MVLAAEKPCLVMEQDESKPCRSQGSLPGNPGKSWRWRCCRVCTRVMLCRRFWGILVLAAEGFGWKTLGMAFLLPQGFPWLGLGGFEQTLPCQGQALHGHSQQCTRARKASVAGKSNKNECSSGKSRARHEDPSKLSNVLAGFVAHRFALLLKSSG